MNDRAPLTHLDLLRFLERVQIGDLERTRRGRPDGRAPRAFISDHRQAGLMASERPVVVYPPDEDGGRRVRVDGQISGRAYSVRDIAAFLQEAGLQEYDEMDVVRSSLIEWRGGGADVWVQ